MSHDDLHHTFTGHFEFFEALRVVIITSDSEAREALRQTIKAWMGDVDAETYFWATGPQAPTMLGNLMTVVEMACEPDAASKASPLVRPIDRNPQGRA
jgi:hypothetical protein